jgi:transglutaminase-like putative cysteine protease
MMALRPRRFHFTMWAAALGVALTLGFFGQAGIGQFQAYLERLNPAWLQRFFQRGTDPSRSRTSIGRIGNLKLSGQIVIRVKPHEGHNAPDYLREASYRAYRTGTWFASGRRESFDGNIGEEYPNSRSWMLLPGRKTNQVTQIACSVPGGTALLPLPTGSWRLENLPAYVLQKNELGAVLCQGPGLVIFDAHFGPGETLDSPPNREDSTTVPPEDEMALEQVVNQLKLREARDDSREAMRRLQAFFSENFTYSTWQHIPRGPRTNSLTPLGRFLLQHRSGHCEYFATATVLLLRKANIPARYAVGYYVHEHSGENYVVRLRDAHAWCLVWDGKLQQWVNFDTTPASWIAEESKLRSSLQWLGDLWTRFTFELAKFRWGQSRVREWLFLLIVPGLVVLAYQIAFRRRRRKRSETDDDAADRVWPGLDSEFYRLEAALAARGFPRAPAEPLSQWLERATESAVLLDLRTPLRQLLRLHYRHRFDPAGLTEAERTALRDEARVCLDQLARLEAAAAVRK